MKPDGPRRTEYTPHDRPWPDRFWEGGDRRVTNPSHRLHAIARRNTRGLPAGAGPAGHREDASLTSRRKQGEPRSAPPKHVDRGRGPNLSRQDSKSYAKEPLCSAVGWRVRLGCPHLACFRPSSAAATRCILIGWGRQRLSACAFRGHVIAWKTGSDSANGSPDSCRPIQPARSPPERRERSLQTPVKKVTRIAQAKRPQARGDVCGLAESVPILYKAEAGMAGFRPADRSPCHDAWRSATWTIVPSRRRGNPPRTHGVWVAGNGFGPRFFTARLLA